MAREAKCTLDGVEYTVPALNIGQLEQVTEAFDGPRTKIPFAVLRIAMHRASPKIDLANASPSMDELATAVQAILETAGLQKGEANPPQQTAVAASS